MKKGLSSRQIKRQHGVDVKEVFSLYEQFKVEVEQVEGNMAKKKNLHQQPVDLQKIMKTCQLDASSLKVKDVLGMLNGKMKTLDEKMFELKQENDIKTFSPKTKVTVRLYSEKAHD